MELHPEFSDAVEMTALLRHHPKFEEMRALLSKHDKDPESYYLLTLDHGGGESTVGVLLSRDGVPFEFEMGEGMERIRPLAPSEIQGDLFLASAPELLVQQGPALERAIAEFDLGGSYLQ